MDVAHHLADDGVFEECKQRVVLELRPVITIHQRLVFICAHNAPRCRFLVPAYELIPARLVGKLHEDDVAIVDFMVFPVVQAGVLSYGITQHFRFGAVKINDTSLVVPWL